MFPDVTKCFLEGKITSDRYYCSRMIVLDARGEKPSQSQIMGVYMLTRSLPCLVDVKFRGIPADKGTGSSLSISVVGFSGFFFQGSTVSILTPTCLLSVLYSLASSLCFISDPVSLLPAYSFSSPVLPVESIPFKSCPAAICKREEFSFLNNHISAMPGYIIGIGYRSAYGEAVLGLDAYPSYNSCDQEGRGHLV